MSEADGSARDIRWDILLEDEDATRRLAMDLATVASAGDFVALSGDLGAGKTAFARALVRTVAGDADLDVPSPTYTLMQAYEAGGKRVLHADLYRVESEADLAETGFAEQAEGAIALVEWAERVKEIMPAERLHIVLRLAPDAGESARRASLFGLGGWGPRLDRLRAVRGFLDGAGWAAARRVPIQGDASTRRYERLIDGARHAILMDAPRRPDGPPVRGGLPYSRIAHLAEDVKPFVAIARGLRDRGYSAPEVLAADLEAGLLVLEDLGAESVLTGVPPAPDPERYGCAVEVLVTLHSLPVSPVLPVAPRVEHRLPRYDMDALLIEVELLLDWYLPHRHKWVPAGGRGEFIALWREALHEASEAGTTWVLRDFHSPNLMWLPERDGPARIGLLDFQDAVMGHPAYDLVSLAQDARVDVSEALELDLLKRYVGTRRTLDPDFDVGAFARAYATLGAQRASKILGIFARLNKRDGKPQYLVHLPRVAGYLRRCLSHPSLERVAAWYDRHVPLSD